MYPRIYTFSILQTLVIPRYPIMNISYLIFSLSLSFYDFRNIENIIRLNHRTRKSKKKLHIQRTKILIRYSTRIPFK